MVPFVALSYEHKIAGLLSLLNMSDRMIDITPLSYPNSKIEEIEEKIELILSKEAPNSFDVEKARNIARRSLLKLCESLNK